MEQESQTFSNQLQMKLAEVERQDWELWILVLAVLGVLGGGFFFVIWPAIFLGERTIYVEASISAQLALGLLFLILLFAIYIVSKHIQIRKQRFNSIKEAWSFEVSHTQHLIDPLTKVFSRAALGEILSKEIKRVQRGLSTIVFLYVDVNDFKAVNTRYGHLSGDLVLAEVGAILKECARGSDYAIRMGGDEFLVALMDTDTAGAEVVKSRINRRVAVWSESSSLPGFQLALSIGIQEFDKTKSFDVALAEADSKMYAEKRK